MNNQVNLNDDELSVIMTALTMTLMSLDKYESQGNTLDFGTKKAKEEMRAIFEKLNKEYF